MVMMVIQTVKVRMVLTDCDGCSDDCYGDDNDVLMVMLLMIFLLMDEVD